MTRPLRAGLLLAALVASGCARSGGAEGALQIVAGGAERTMEARSFRMTVAVDDGVGPDLTYGAVDLDRDLSWFGPDEGGEPDSISVRDGSYTRADVIGPYLGATTPWLFFDVKKMAEAYERARAEAARPGDPAPPVFFDQEEASLIPGVPGAGSSGHIDPASLLGQLRERTEGVEEEGREDVRGVAATRYRVRFDEARLRKEAEAQVERRLAKMPPEEREEWADVLRSSVGDPVPGVSVWVSDDGLVRRVDRTEVLDGDDSDGDPGDDEELRTRFEFYDFGVPVTVALPRPEDVTPFHTLPRAFQFDTDITIASPGDVPEWHPISEGALAGTRWFFEAGTTGDDVACLRVRTDPPFDNHGFDPGPPLPPGVPLPEGLELPEGFELPDRRDLLEALEGMAMSEGFELPEGSDLSGPPPPPGPPGPDELLAQFAAMSSGTCDDGWLGPRAEAVTGAGPIGYAYGRVPARADRAEARFAGEARPEPVPLHEEGWVVVFDSARPPESVRFFQGDRRVLDQDL